MTTRTDTHRIEQALRHLPPVQAGSGVTGGVHHLPAIQQNVTWGWLPSGRDQPVGQLAPGDVVCIDTISHEGLMGDQGNDPGVDGPHVVTGPIAVIGARPGDVVKGVHGSIRTADFR